jgi:hypothetical protein
MDQQELTCEACGCTVARAETVAGAEECYATNNMEHVFRGLRRYIVLALASCDLCRGKGIVAGRKCVCATVEPAP